MFSGLVSWKIGNTKTFAHAIEEDRIMIKKSDWYDKENNAMIFHFEGKTKTLSSSVLQGGLRTDLKYALNINCQGNAYESEMLEETYEKELMRQVRSCGMDPSQATALSTSAWLELSAECTRTFRELEVRAVVSGGIDYNAVAPGDPTSYYEEDGTYQMLHPGTVNIFVFVNQNLTDSAMVRGMMVITEAKASAVRELMLGSCYSTSLATGSGTDGCVLAANMDSSHLLTDATGHSKLGELLGDAVKTAVKQALLNQTAANGARQFRLLQRVRRYGITQGTLYDQYKEYEGDYRKLGVSFENAAAFDAVLNRFQQNSNLVLITSLYVHLLDQKSWGLILNGEVLRDGKHLLQTSYYVGDHQFLKDCYPEEAFEVERFSSKNQTADPVHLLEHFLLLFLGAV